MCLISLAQIAHPLLCQYAPRLEQRRKVRGIVDLNFADRAALGSQNHVVLTTAGALLPITLVAACGNVDLSPTPRPVTANLRFVDDLTR